MIVCIIAQPAAEGETALSQEGSLGRQLPAGVIDSGFASLAGFGVALTAER
jgi:hypothetical protein